MGTTESKPAFNEALGLLTSQTQPIESGDLGFWDHFWSDSVGSVQHLFAGTTAEDVRSLREKSPANLATLAFKAVEKLLQASETGCSTQQEQQTVLNCVRVLTRVLPFVLEEADWRGLFWTSPSSQVAGEAAADTERQKQDGGERRRSQTAAHAHPPAAHTLISALCDLLFCPDFTVAPTANPNSPDQHEDIQSIDSCEYIWSQGVGFTGSVVHSSQHDANRCELLKLLLTAFSETIFLSADGQLD